MKNDLIMVYCSCPAADGETQTPVAQSLARQLVSQRLAACVNILPAIESVYRWQGQVCVDNESLLIIKTRASRLAAISALLEAQHPYELPELVAVPVVAGSDDYLAWMAEEME